MKSMGNRYRRSAVLIGALSAILSAVMGSASAIYGEEGAVRRYEVEGLYGDPVKLPCEVDTKGCGGFHNIKWYKDVERVYVFSERDDFKRAEGSLEHRTDFNFVSDRKENWLQISPLEVTDEGQYRCEITYLIVREVCSIVQFTNLTTYVRPTFHRITLPDGSALQNGTTIGPYDEGDNVELRCEAGAGKPVPSVTWYNGTTKLQGDYRTTMYSNGTGTGVNTLRVSVGRGDLTAGGLRCRVTGGAVSRPVELVLGVDVNVAPRAVKITQLQSSPLVAGDQVTLKCEAHGAKPAATIRWYNGSKPLLPSRQLKEDVGERRSSDNTILSWSQLKFDATRFDNRKRFSCQASNGVIERRRQQPVSSSHTLDVQFAPSVRVSPDNITVNEFANFLIRCDYDANPRDLTYVLWYRDNQQLDISSRPNKYGNGNLQQPSLLVRNASDADTGDYTCRLSNAIGDSAVLNHVPVNVHFPPVVSVTMSLESPVSERAAVNVTLSCTVVRANPAMLRRVRWFLDDTLLKELPECDGNETLYGYERSQLCDIDPSLLVLQNVTRDFHGNYSCRAMNEAGWGERSEGTQLEVHYPPGNTMVTYEPWQVIKTKTVYLDCGVDDPGRPIATHARWYQGGRLVPDETNLQWPIYSVYLSSNYTCIPYNSEGDGTSASVDIEVMTPPTFITRLPPYQGHLKDTRNVSMTCRVECSPLCTISWLKDGAPLRNTSHFRISSTVLDADPSSGDLESRQSVLEWQMDQWTNGGLNREQDNSSFTCVSSGNVAGNGVSSSSYFRVEYPPENISVSQYEVSVIENNVPPHVACQAYSYPEPSYEWRHNGTTVSGGSVLNFGGPVVRAASGEYGCVASNRHGNVTKRIVLDVMYKPECSISRSDDEVGETRSIVLHCASDANPNVVTFRWRKGNESVEEDITAHGAESKLRLPAVQGSLGTYYCYVNNTVGESLPCEIDVNGMMGVIAARDDGSLWMIVAVAVAVLVVVLVVVVVVMLCRRRAREGKYPNQAPLQQTSVAPVSSEPNGMEPADKRDFYENLPFHGMAAPPEKPLHNLAGDMIYADVDSDTYAYGPIMYKAESVKAANALMAEREAEASGAPVRPPRNM